MKELYWKVAADSVLQDKFAEIVRNAENENKETVAEKLVEFAKESGYEATIEELKAFLEREGELSDSELDMVAGGKSQNGRGNVIGSVFTLGITCAVGSVLFELDRVSGESIFGCKDHFQ